jgi:hypothetical protein
VREKKSITKGSLPFTVHLHSTIYNEKKLISNNILKKLINYYISNFHYNNNYNNIIKLV